MQLQIENMLSAESIGQAIQTVRGCTQAQCRGVKDEVKLNYRLAKRAKQAEHVEQKVKVV